MKLKGVSTRRLLWLAVHLDEFPAIAFTISRGLRDLRVAIENELLARRLPEIERDVEKTIAKESRRVGGHRVASIRGVH